MHFLHPKYPNDRAVKPVSTAREAETPAEGIPDWRNCKTCHRRTRM